MKTYRKGSGTVAWIIVIAVVLIVGIVAGWLLGNGGFGIGGGKGDGEGTGEIESFESTTEKEKPVIEELKYIEITVSGSEYLYQNSKYTLEKLIEELNSQSLDAPIKIKDENSSLKAYKNLKTALSDNNIRYIEAN